MPAEAAVSWSTIAALATAMVAFATLNFLALQWLLGRHDNLRQENATKIEVVETKIGEVEHEIYGLKAQLPIDYVRREDWIRFGATLDAKMDAMRAEIREELSQLKGRNHAGRD